MFIRLQLLIGLRPFLWALGTATPVSWRVSWIEQRWTQRDGWIYSCLLIFLFLLFFRLARRPAGLLDECRCYAQSFPRPTFSTLVANQYSCWILWFKPNTMILMIGTICTKHKCINYSNKTPPFWFRYNHNFCKTDCGENKYTIFVIKNGWAFALSRNHPQ